MADEPVNVNDAFNQAFEGNTNTDAAFNQAFTPAPTPGVDMPDRAPAAIPQGPVNVLNPEGKLVSIPSEQLPDALNSGYSVATPEHVEAYKKEQKYGSPLQQIATGLEGAAESSSFGLSTGIEKAFGVKDEDIRGRRETNPIAHGTGQVGGLLAGTLYGASEAKALGVAGEAAAEALGLGAANTTISRIGSGAVKAAVENGLFQAGDEVSKMISKDPNQSVETAAADIGLASLLGGGIGGAVGAAQPLWQATMGSKLAQSLDSIAKKTGGIEGITDDAVGQAIQKSGMDIAPEMRAAISNDPELQMMAKTLEQSDTTKSGMEFQKSLKTFKEGAQDKIIEAFGKTRQDVESLADMSEHEIGTQIKSTLKDQVKQVVDPISEQFEKVKTQFKDVELPKEMKAEIADQIAKVSSEQGYTLSASAPGRKVVNDVLTELPGLKSLEDLRKYQSIIGERASKEQLWQLGKDLRGIFRSAEDKVLDSAIGEQAPELAGSHANARAAYKRAMDTIDTLNDRLHVGRFNGPGSFLKALNDMAPEDVLRRLSPKGDAGIINELTEKFPQVAQQLKDFHVSQLLRTAAQRAKPGDIINSSALLTTIDKLSPEMRNFLVPAEAQGKIQAVGRLLEEYNKLPHNFSNTARTMDKLFEYVPASAAGMVTLLLSHNPVVAAVVGGLTKYLGKDIPDAARLALLKFMGSSKPIDAGAFKSMVEMIQSTIKGENMAVKGVKNVFKAGQEVLPQAYIPTAKDREKLDKQIKNIQKDQSSLFNAGGNTGHYMPEHATAIGEVAARSVAYLNTLRPDTDKKSPLDSKPVVSNVAQSRYNRALDIAQSPLIVLKHMKEGTLTTNDIKDLNAMYPNLYSKLNQKLMSEIVTASQKGITIPYKTKMSMSLFMGQTLDSTLDPSSILAAQPKSKQPMQEQGEQSPTRHNTNALNKLSSSYNTPNQARDRERASGK
jgi:hypothetical protein